MFATARLGALSAALAVSVFLVAGCGRSASWSPSGRSLAIDIGGKLQLFDVATGTFTPLETGGRYAVNPAFSPNAKQVAYYGITKAEGKRATCDIWVQDPGKSSGSERKIASDVFRLKGEPLLEAATHIRGTMVLAWSPDGRKLAHSRMAEERGAIEIVDLESGDVTRCGRSGESQIMPAWSPSGTRIAYLAETHSRMAEPGVAFDLCVADVDSSATPERIGDSPTHGEIWPYWPITWSADGAGVVVLTQQNGSSAFEARLVPAAGGASRLLTRVDTAQATITPDLQVVVYMGGDQNGAVIYKSAQFQREQVLDRIAPWTRREPAPLEIPAVPLYPVISPDGKTVVLPLVNEHRELRLYEVASGRKRVYPIP